MYDIIDDLNKCDNLVQNNISKICNDKFGLNNWEYNIDIILIGVQTRSMTNANKKLIKINNLNINLQI